MNWELVMGLEVHAQLKTDAKLFSGSSTHFGALPNTQASFIDAALPGSLPVLNEKALSLAIAFGLSIDAQISPNSYFERKNYFYPDLPKGYQISQNQNPIVQGGHLEIELSSGLRKKVHLVRAHLEEDAGKSLHEARIDATGIDLNRAGNPLLEIVTTPCLHSTEEVLVYLKDLQQLLRFLKISDANLQEGSFRCDVNISLRPEKSQELGTRCEIKNLNSFRFIEKAIAYEAARQEDLLNQGLKVKQETRLFCQQRLATYAMRSKEDEHDYRYFPDPDLLPIDLFNLDLELMKRQLPKLPKHLKELLREEDNLSAEHIEFLLSHPSIYEYFSRVKEASKTSSSGIVNWLKGPLMTAITAKNLSFSQPPVEAPLLAQLLNRLESKTLNTTTARQVFAFFLEGQSSIDEIIEKQGFNQASDSSLIEETLIKLIETYPQQVEEFRQGKEKLLAFFVGKAMQALRGKANPEELSHHLKEHLKQR